MEPVSVETLLFQLLCLHNVKFKSTGAGHLEKPSLLNNRRALKIPVHIAGLQLPYDVEPVLVETLLSQLLCLPHSPHPPVAYMALLVSLSHAQCSITSAACSLGWSKGVLTELPVKIGLGLSIPAQRSILTRPGKALC